MKGRVDIIGVPIDLGQRQRGVDMGASAMRYAGLSGRIRALGYELHDAGNLYVPVRDCLAESCDQESFVAAIAQVCQAAYESAAETVRQRHIPLFLGGDHSLSIGTIGGVTSRKGVGVLWIDAHGDANTPETSPSGNIHGMPLAILLGEGPAGLVNIGRPGPKLRGEEVVMIGLRDLDSGERDLLKRCGVRVYSMRDIDERGIGSVIREALTWLHAFPALHVSLDMDSLDPEDAPGVGTPCPGGLSYREAQLLMETIADSGKLMSLDVVEINPILDVGNRTARIAVELIESLLGKSII
jgi:arginase